MDAQTSLQVQEKPWRKQPASPFMLSLRISDSFFPFLISLCCPPGKWELEGGGGAPSSTSVVLGLCNNLMISHLAAQPSMGRGAL